MKKWRSIRTISLLAWIVISVLSLLWMPNLDQLVREKGQVAIPESAQSEIAQSMISNMDANDQETYQLIAIFTSEKDKLTNDEKVQIAEVIAKLKKDSGNLGIQEIMSHLDDEETEKQLVSEDKMTILTQLSVSKDYGEISEIASAIDKEIQVIDGVETYLTGTDLVLEDFVQSTQEGIQKTEIIAIVFILVVLILVFKSPIVPFISLLTVGVSYLVSLGIITNLVDKFNFPFSNFTQVFLVVILFGIGTDYNILLLTRFKEELSKQENVLLAIKETYRTAGKTVVFSGLAVFIGFSVLFLAKFKLYQACSAVAIGVAILILVLYTLNPFFMYVLGKKMYWPVKRFEGHADSKIWGFLAGNSVVRPWLSLLIIAILCIPFIFNYTNVLSYNDLIEVDDAYESKQGINVIEEHFSAGFSSPTTLVLHNDTKLDNQKSLQVIDELTEKVSKINGVSGVYSVTRPGGEKIKELYINDQTKELNSGLSEAKSGVGEINEGLSSAGKKVGGTDTGQIDSVQKLIDGTSAAKNGVSQLNDAVNQLSAGIDEGAAGAGQLKSGLTSLKGNVETLSTATSQLYKGYSELETGLGSFGNSFSTISQAIDGAKQGYAQIEQVLKAYMEDNPEAANESRIQTAFGTAVEGQKQLTNLSQELKKITPKYQTAMKSFKEANASLAKVNEGMSQTKQGIGQLEEGAQSLETELENGTNASKQIVGSTTNLESGLAKVNEGQTKLQDGLKDLTGKMNTLQEGLSKSTKGLDQVSEGLEDAQGYLGNLSQSKAAEKFYIPEDVLSGDEFQKSLDKYLSENKNTTTMTIILDVNPYSAEAMDIVREINKQVPSALVGTELDSAKLALGGKTAQNVDLQDISSQDFTRTAVIMLIGIGLVLILITRSILQPIFIVGSLVLAYYTSLGLGELVSTKILGVDSLGWNVPFFSFIMIVALGVDYSIFLMMRFNELEGSIMDRIVAASRQIGGVVISAALILGGTFAALMPSGVITLIGVATVVIFGLFILSFIMLPMFIPALMSLVEKTKRKNKEKA